MENAGVFQGILSSSPALLSGKKELYYAELGGGEAKHNGD
jgi:hypothetical protein